MKKTYNSQYGFSLVEAVVALFIIGVILTLYQASLNTVFLISNTKNQEIALKIANNKMEELRADGYAALPDNGSFSDSQLDLLSGSSAAMTITDFNSDTKQIVIVIQWQGRGSAVQQTISATTLITKTGGL